MFIILHLLWSLEILRHLCQKHSVYPKLPNYPFSLFPILPPKNYKSVL